MGLGRFGTRARVVVGLVAVVATSAARAADAAAATPQRDDDADRLYFDVSLTGSELDGPTPAGGYDADLFRGLGLTFEGGRVFGAWRVGGAVHAHYADNALLGYVVADDSVSFVAVTADAWRDVRFSRSFGGYVGAGAGLADVDVTFSGYEPDPPFSDYWEAHADGTVAAGQVMVGVWFDPFSGGRTRMHVGFRYFVTGGVNGRDSFGRRFDNDRIEMPMAVLGFTWTR